MIIVGFFYVDTCLQEIELTFPNLFYQKHQLYVWTVNQIERDDL